MLSYTQGWTTAWAIYAPDALPLLNVYDHYCICVWLPMQGLLILTTGLTFLFLYHTITRYHEDEATWLDMKMTWIDISELYRFTLPARQSEESSRFTPIGCKAQRNPVSQSRTPLDAARCRDTLSPSRPAKLRKCKLTRGNSELPCFVVYVRAV